jgi:hypothetical protein
MEIMTTVLGRAMRAPQVMVSYSSRDRERVMQLVQALRQAGVALWIDHIGIDGAQRWSEEIVDAIEACSVLLLFISRSSMESVNIPKEVALAWESGKEFLPVALEEAKVPKSMQYQLAGIQYVKLYEGDPEVKFEAVLRALVRKGVRVSPYAMAMVSAGIGERERALEWLSKACDEHAGGLARLKTEPRFNSMRTDPRFVQLARRAETIALEEEDASAEIVLPQPPTPAPQPVVPAGPAPMWKRLLWPDIVDDRTARQAAALGVWASAAIIVSSWLFSFLIPTSTIAMQGWWNDPIVLTLIFGAIGFGVQKMGRPAAVIGAVLCALGALGNMQLVQTMRAVMAAQEIPGNMVANMGNQPQLSGIYYSAWFGLLAGIAFVAAFVNACRGTFAYRQMVQARQAQDKQDALSPQDLLAARRKVAGLVQRVWGSGPLTVAAPNVRSDASAAAATSSAAPPARAQTPIALEPERMPSPAAAPVDRPIAVGESRLAFSAGISSAPQPRERMAVMSSQRFAPALAGASEAASINAATDTDSAIDQFPVYDDAPDVHTLGDLVGANPLRLSRALAFLAANVASGMAFMLGRSLMLQGTMHPVYWQFALLHGIAVTLATWLAFRFVRSGWTAALVAAFGMIALLLPVYHYTLGSFNIADLFYREQFQEFLLLPFVDVLVTLLGLFYLIPRVRPLVLGLWVGSVCAEVATSMLITTLRDLGSGPPPDPILSGILVFFVGIRSLVFTAVFWGGLKLTGVGRSAARQGRFD